MSYNIQYANLASKPGFINLDVIAAAGYRISLNKLKQRLPQ